MVYLYQLSYCGKTKELVGIASTYKAGVPDLFRTLCRRNRACVGWRGFRDIVGRMGWMYFVFPISIGIGDYPSMYDRTIVKY